MSDNVSVISEDVLPRPDVRDEDNDDPSIEYHDPSVEGNDPSVEGDDPSVRDSPPSAGGPF